MKALLTIAFLMVLNFVFSQGSGMVGGIFTLSLQPITRTT